MKQLVLLGGGESHLQVLDELAASPCPNVQVSLVSPGACHWQSSLLPLWIEAGEATPEIGVPLAPRAQRAGARWIDSDLLFIDREQRQLALTNGQVLSYDALSIDAQVVPHREAIAGARENALFVRPMDQFAQLWPSVMALSEQRVLSLVVVGSDALAVELAIAIQRRLQRRARVALVTGGAAPVPWETSGFQRRLRQALRRQQVTVFEDSCEAIALSQMLLGRGMRLACDAPLIALPGIAPLWLSDSGLSLDGNGFLRVGANGQSLSHPEIFGVGELVVCPDAGARTPPGQPWSARGPALAANLRRFLEGGQPAEPVRASARRLLATGGGCALGRLGGWTAENRWLGWWKARSDRRLMNRCTALNGADSQHSSVADVSQPEQESVV